MKLPKIIIKRYEEHPLYRETTTEPYLDYAVEMRVENLTSESSKRVYELMFQLSREVNVNLNNSVIVDDVYEL